MRVFCNGKKNKAFLRGMRWKKLNVGSSASVGVAFSCYCEVVDIQNLIGGDVLTSILHISCGENHTWGDILLLKIYWCKFSSIYLRKWFINLTEFPPISKAAQHSKCHSCTQSSLEQLAKPNGTTMENSVPLPEFCHKRPKKKERKKKEVRMPFC